MSAAEGARRGRPPLSDDERRRRRLAISREAVRLFRLHGVSETTGEDIARAAGVSERTVWRLFRSKEACVEPLLTTTVDAFVAVLRTWPPDVELADHLASAYDLGEDAPHADVDAVLAVLRLSRDEPGLRAVWLVLHERAEATLAELLGARVGRPPDAPEVRVQAAAVNAALRVVTDDFAALVVGGVTTASRVRHRGRLAATLGALTRLPEPTVPPG